MVAWKSWVPSSTRRSATHAPVLARLLTVGARLVVMVTGWLEVSGSVPEALRGKPCLLAANHIGVFDTAVLVAACHRVGIAPRMVANGGLMQAPIIGAALRRAGHLGVDPVTAGCAVRGTGLRTEIEAGRPVLIYPEGRISRDPDLWPDRGQTGLARLALVTGLPVLTLSQWGAQRVIPVDAPPVRSVWGFVRLALIWVRAVGRGRRITFRVHLGGPVDLTGLAADRTGGAIRAHARIMMALTASLVPLRAGDPAVRTEWVGRPSPWRPVT